MSFKRIGIIVTFVLSGILAAFLLHRGIASLGKSPQAIATRSSSFSCPQSMVWIEQGNFSMGAKDHYQEEAPAKDITVDGFCMDQHEVTNADFRQFVKETGYATVAERPLPADLFPQLTEAQRAPGSLMFVKPTQAAIRELSWWRWVQGADWQHPQGPESSIDDKDDYPVVHIAYEDVQAYAQWAGKMIPTEAQWEFAARGGLINATFTWGDRYASNKANTWQGEFPYENKNDDGYLGTAPIGSFPPNNYGLYDMAGNVWEWTADWYRPGHEGKAHQHNPVVSNPEESFDPREPGVAKHVLKGGSYLCSANYCSRFRPAAREAQSPDTGASHIGFRLITMAEASNS